MAVSHSNEENKNMSNHDMRIGKYRLLTLLSERRYTDVWLAEHIDLKKKVAIKILFPQDVRAGDERLRAKKQFFKEARTLAQLSHPNIVQAFEYGVEEKHGWPYFVMEYAPYGSLKRRHRPGEQLPLSTVRAYTSQVGRAIHYVHTRGLIHRDIKPQNMFLKTRSLVLLGDFGLVMRKHYKYYPRMMWEFGGTRAYMAPEQERGEPCPASDQYAFATTVFEWLTGYRPFYGTAGEIAWRRENLAPPSMRAIAPEIPAAVERVVLTALHKTPDRRFKTILDFTLEFEEACKPVIATQLYDMSASRSRRVMVSHRSESASRDSAMLRQQPPGRFARQPALAEQGDVLLAPSPHLVPLRRQRIEEEPRDPMLTSDGNEINIVLPSRVRSFWSRVRIAWQRIAGPPQEQCL
jgi:serine/threonine protein kinase